MKKFHNPQPAAGSGPHDRRPRRLVRIGQLLVAAGALVVISHWFAHPAPAGQGPGITEDMFIGYPAGGVLLLTGAVVAGRIETRKG